ncbi:MAG: DUF7344 domain-containing protein [Halobacteriota archaeon]
MSQTQHTNAVLEEAEVFHILGNDRRREVIHRLSATERPVPISNLAESIAEEEAGPNSSGDDLYRSVYVSLHQTHLPKLVEEDVVEYDVELGEIRPGSRLKEVSLYVGQSSNYRKTLDEAPLITSTMALLVILGSYYGFPLLSNVSVGVWGVFFLCLIALTTIVLNVPSVSQRF